MTAEQLHDALNLLPGDLITAADKLRIRSVRKPLRWQHWTAMAACFVLLAGAAFVLRQEVWQAAGSRPERADTAAQENQSSEAFITGQTEPASPGESPAEDRKDFADTNRTTDEKDGDPEFGYDHSHSFAQESDTSVNSHNYCGNMEARIYLDGEEYVLAGGDAAALAEILENLNYDPNETCRCAAEFRVDTELLTGVQVSLSQGFARCEKGQAPLSKTQVEILQEILDAL